MYDRKTWIVLALCGILIALNIHFGAKNRATAEQQKKETPAEQASTTQAPVGLTVEPLSPAPPEEIITLENDKAIFALSNIGGGIKYIEIKNQKIVGDKNTNVRINQYAPGPVAAIVNSDHSIDNVSYQYKPEQSSPGSSAVFIAKLSSGIIVKKTFSLETRDIPGKQYFIKLNIALENTLTTNIDLASYSLFLGTAGSHHKGENASHTGFFWFEDGQMHFNNVNKFRGGWFSSDKSIITSPSQNNITYAGISDQFFTTIIRPQNPALTAVWGKPQTIQLSPNTPSLPAVRAALSLPPLSVAPGSMTSLDYTIFAGPKDNTMLRKLDNHKAAGTGWGEIMQYGWFSIVSRFLNWLLNVIHNLVDNFSTTQSWGLAIIFLTIIVRILIWPLHAKSTRVMKRMSKLQPIMKELKEKYPDDPNKLNMEMMGLYRKYGINPLGGCLPMFIQIPIFFGFFRMLDYAVELRNQSFLWVDDLSQPDTFHTFHLPFSFPFIGETLNINILPIVMAVTSVLQIAMMPKTGDKMQQRIIMLMPIMFFVFCYGYASALALYWTTQNIFSIAQTYFMNKIPEPELVARKDGGKKSWVQRMAEKQAEMQKLQQKHRANSDMRNVTPTKKRPPRTGG